MVMELSPRFDYGRSVPWIYEEGDVLEAAVGPDALDVSATVGLDVEGGDIPASFEVSEGDAAAFICRYRPSDSPMRTKPGPQEWRSLLDRTERFWTEWASRCRYAGAWRHEVIRSLLTMKALTYSSTGGLVAAVTTSLPENLGGTRNWDYRYCWLRDSTLALEVLIDNGYQSEAEEFHDWILRAMGGDADQIQVMYAPTGERRLPELKLDWLEGYEDSRPVRVGNAATEQFQLDVCGEVMDLFHTARRAGIDRDRAWPVQVDMAELVCKRWGDPDHGIWEMRVQPRQYVHSKAMAWVALDRAIKAVSDYGKPGAIDRWQGIREEIRSEVLDKGVDRKRGCLTMSYGTREVDSSLLRLPLVGFLAADDDVMAATIEAIEQDLVIDGLVRRYRTKEVDDGIGESEGAFFLCTFWLVCCYVLYGRKKEAQEMFNHAVSLANDVGLFAEQYDHSVGRQVGNFPQAFSHFSLVTAALALERGVEAPGLIRGA